ncbi:AMP-binding protein (plasmid) [Streptomyces sp. NBC_00536]|uniref:class I adenylate-forming enzyme family protein n=1 Tax=Streptomyces sp. NBC_00536 TaxID=2975769 RepID=UPI002E81E170|nr:AMP-binding protein [Streptomyces sp. NBC_00536]WUC84111.1 AMP-binding protein [Streptomyces sp. NBC_00536]
MWLNHVVRRGLDRTPDALALRDAGRDVSWRRLHRDVEALAARLRRDVPRGSRVLVLSGNRVEVIETYLACASAAVVAVPVNPALTDREIEAIAGSVEPAAAVADAEGLARLAALYPGLPLTDITAVAGLPDAGLPDAGLPDAGLPDAGPEPTPHEGAGLADPVMILHTSATTGTAKGVVVDQRSLQLNALSWLADVGPRPGTVFLNAGPLFHGSVVIALDHLAAGGTVCVLDRFTPQGCLAALERWQVEHAFLVPSMVRLTLDARALPSTDLGALRLLLHGAAPMPAELAVEARGRLGVELQTVFGITEGGGPVVSLAPHTEVGAPPVPGAVCVGRPMLGTALRITDSDGREVGQGTLGEVQVAGAGLMQGYWKRPEATAEVLRDGWLNTHDMGCVDADGLVWIVDRRNDLILRGGQNVYPAEIEHVLRQSPNVADVVVVPVESPVWGQIPVAFVQPRTPEAFDAAELLGLCIEGLAAYKRPSHFLPLETVPRNPAGKALRPRLRELAHRLVIESENTP